MDVYLHALGCRLNEAELESWHRGFEGSGHRVVSAPEQAQVVVLNTCAVTGVAARKSRQLVHRFHRQNPAARMVITGCYAELAPEKVADMAGVDLVVGNHEKGELVSKVAEHLDGVEMPRMASEPDGRLYAEARTRAFVKVQDGCRNKCSFCVVTILRGQERSRPVAEVVAEINDLHAQGFQEAVVTGVHLGGYGSDLSSGDDLKALLAAILADTDIPRLRVTSLEPWDLPKGFFSLWENPRLGQHLHLPLQSGCDSVLRRMARRCYTADFAALVDDAREILTDLTLTTDIIVGFPGETEAEWAATREFIERMGFAHMHIFAYSPREGTRAATLPGQVSRQIQKRRSQELHEIGAVMKAAHLERFLGQQRPVLWEGRGEALGDGQRRWLGYTDNYLRVETVAPESVDLENHMLPTRLDMSTGEMLLGTVQDQP